MNFSERSYQRELLDREDIPFEDIRRNMQELDVINKYLGGHRITVNGFKMILGKITNNTTAGERIVSICEIGCGGGDNLRVLKNYCEKRSIKAAFSGIDINPHCIEFARSRKENTVIDFIASDYKGVRFAQRPDIIFCSLFTHHFPDADVVDILTWMKENSRIGFFINDLHRHPFAYYSIKWLTAIFSKSYLVKNDAALSVLRGFKRKEWQRLNARAAVSNSVLAWKWAFRWLVVYFNE